MRARSIVAALTAAILSAGTMAIVGAAPAGGATPRCTTTARPYIRANPFGAQALPGASFTAVEATNTTTVSAGVAFDGTNRFIVFRTVRGAVQILDRITIGSGAYTQGRSVRVIAVTASGLVIAAIQRLGYIDSFNGFIYDGHTRRALTHPAGTVTAEPTGVSANGTIVGVAWSGAHGDGTPTVVSWSIATGHLHPVLRGYHQAVINSEGDIVAMRYRTQSSAQPAIAVLSNGTHVRLVGSADATFYSVWPMGAGGLNVYGLLSDDRLSDALTVWQLNHTQHEGDTVPPSYTNASLRWIHAIGPDGTTLVGKATDRDARLGRYWRSPTNVLLKMPPERWVEGMFLPTAITATGAVIYTARDGLPHLLICRA